MNRLTDERSRYLLQHKDNPVHWLPWGEEAFRRAEEEGKPILLSIGYSSCHWCHVMAHESFEDKEVARILNEKFISVKLDKEEYPDIDAFYMEYMSTYFGVGGWPLNVFVNPGKAPFFGTTYLPKREFIDALGQISSQYMADREFRTKPFSYSYKLPDVSLKQAKEIVGMQPILERGNGPQFPQASLLLFALDKGKDISPFIHDYISKGLYDHISGGFFRYTVDPGLKIPHFEKMLYDQAMLLLLLAEAHAKSPREEYAYTIRKTITFLESLRLPSGMYASATDADTTAGEGMYYTILENGPAYRNLFRLDECGVHNKRFVPCFDHKYYQVNKEESERMLDELRKERSLLEPPGVDTKAVVSWNAMLGYSLLRCADALGDAAIRKRAQELHSAMAARIKVVPHIFYDDEPFGKGYLADKAAWLLFSKAIGQDISLDLSGYVDGKLRHSLSEFDCISLWQDSPFPSGGSMLLLATGDKSLAEKASGILSQAKSYPTFFGFWMHAFAKVL